MIDGCLALRISYFFRKENLDNPPYLPTNICSWKRRLRGRAASWTDALELHPIYITFI
jgi:hypothetical protein